MFRTNILILYHMVRQVILHILDKTNMSKTNPILSINLTPEDVIYEMEGYSEIIKVYFATPKCNKMQSKNVTP